MSWFEALVLGIVQGITEFLPVSSDGHLTITQHAFEAFQRTSRSGKQNLFFDIMLHVGTLAAIRTHYRRTIAQGVKGFFGSTNVPLAFQRRALVHIGILVFVSLLPLIPYVKLKDTIEQALESLIVTGIGFLVTAAALLVTHWVKGGDRGPATTRWWHALAIGVAQAFAPLPGISRSGLTIAMALVLGFERGWAVDFSLMIAVPAILGATVFELKDLDRASLSSLMIAQTVAAATVAGIVGYFAIKWLAMVVKNGRVWYYSVYLVILGLAVLAWGIQTERKGQTNVEVRATTLDRSEGWRIESPRGRGTGGGSVGALAGRDRAGA